MPQKYEYFVGIDVSKNKLDCAFFQAKEMLSHQVIQNNEDALLTYVKELKTYPGFALKKCVFGLEQTGVYTTHVLAALKRLRVATVLEDATYIRNLLGKLRGKYDKIDAIRIASFLYKNRLELKLWEPRRKIISELSGLASLRLRLISTYHALKVPLNEAKLFNNFNLSEKYRSLCNDSLTAMQNDLASVELNILASIKSDNKLCRLYNIITSVPGVGMVTAVQILISTNEFLDIKDPKRFASYAGVAPFRKESGTFVGKSRVSQMANKRMKTLLHICAVSSIAYKNELQDYYFRKTKQEGKPKMLVLNAIRYKIILRVFACINQDRMFEKNHKTTSDVSLN